MLGALMFVSKIILEVLPNIHLLGMFTMLYTIVYRGKALIPIYLFVFIQGVWSGFALWWIPYLYLWLVLWGITMLLPKNLPTRYGAILYPIINALFGLLYGTLYAPSQALLFGLDFKGMLLWILQGLPWDVTHAIGNLIAGLLIVPLSKILLKIKQFPTK